MNVTERPLAFRCQGQRLLGVLAEPAQAGDLGLLFIVGGPQYRAGSHRQFVLQARSAAAAGVPTLRFDVRGMGDSEGELRDFEHMGADIGAAIDALMQAVPGLRRVVLWGLCDGASAALLYLDESRQDARVQGLCLLNPWVRSAATLAATHVKHYYAQRLLQRDFWAKLLRGQVAGQALRGLLRSLRLTLLPAAAGAGAASTVLPYQQRMARAWSRFGGHILLVLSGNDYTAKEFLQAWALDIAWQSAARHPCLQRVDLPYADHTFSAGTSRQAVEAACLNWLSLLAGTVAPAADTAAANPAREDAHAP